MKEKKELALTRKDLASFESASWEEALLDLLASLAMYGAVIVFLFNFPIRGWGFILYLVGIILAALLQIKIFTIQHDCGHRSYTPSPLANRWIGRLCSLLTTVPYRAWQYDHARHHASFGVIEDQPGDLWILTQEDYNNLPIIQKWAYRVYRKPLFFLLIGPIVWLGMMQRIPPTSKKKDVWWSAVGSSFIFLMLYTVLFMSVGWSNGCLVFMPIWYIAGMMGIVTFRLQHQFEGAEWKPQEMWDFEKACMSTTSTMDMPPWIHWFFGYIGYHSIHHFSVKIPSYRLPDAFKELRHKVTSRYLKIGDIWSSLSLGVTSPQEFKLLPFQSHKS